jgi:hypothetical protein
MLDPNPASEYEQEFSYRENNCGKLKCPMIAGVFIEILLLSEGIF